jgi:hypothetical protein
LASQAGNCGWVSGAASGTGAMAAAHTATPFPDGSGVIELPAGW